MKKSYVVYDNAMSVPDFAIITYKDKNFYHGHWGLAAKDIIDIPNEHGQMLYYKSAKEHIDDKGSAAVGILGFLPKNYTEQNVDKLIESYKNKHPEYYI